MINQESQLRLQAYLDGELSVRDAAEMRDWLARDAEAQALHAELKNTRSSLVGNEPECRVPESREFFWSKIEREIQRQSHAERPVAAQSSSWFAWLRQHFVPVTGVALLSCMLALMVARSGNPAQVGEVELASDDMGSYTYRDQQNKMTMVWLYDRSSADSQFTDTPGLATVAPE